MQCFKCHSLVADGTAICPHCDAILDASILDEETGVGVAPEPTDPDAITERPQSRFQTAEDQPVPADYWAPEAHDESHDEAASTGEFSPDPANLAAPAPLHQSTRIISSDPERDKKTRVVSAPPPPRLPRRDGARADPDPDSILSSDFDAALDGARQVYARLNTPERVSLWATLAAFVSAFLPWYYIKGYGLLSGIQTHGWIVALMSLAAMTLLYLRYHLRLGLLFSVGQVLCIAGAAFVAGWFVVHPAIPQMRFGLPAAALAGAVAAVSGIFGLFRRT